MIWADLLATLALGALLARLAIIDLATLRLPDRLTWPLILAGIAYHWVHGAGFPWTSLVGAALGYAVFAGLGAIYFRVRRIDGLGLGDAKLLAGAGAWLGYAALPWVVLIAALGALAHAAWTRVAPRRALAFGPWLAAAIWLVWVFALARDAAAGQAAADALALAPRPWPDLGPAFVPPCSDPLTLALDLGRAGA